ncbi:MAG: PilN domain-containing protein [Candidatus Aminicenantes bacterium]|jgi:Tfp pilus assembly protein PilN
MIRVNLLKPEHKEAKETPAVPSQEVTEKKKQPKTGLIFLLFIVAVLALYFVQEKNLRKEKLYLDDATEEKQQYQDVAVLLNQVEQQKILLERKINLINTLKARQHVAVNIMDELSLNLPDWVWLVEASYDRNEVRIKGKALSNTLIADYIFNLENSLSFGSVNLISSAQQGAGGDEYLEFSLTAVYVLPRETDAPDEKANKEKK